MSEHPTSNQDASTSDRPLNALLERVKQSRHYRLVKFAAVGGSGVVVNQGLLWLGVAVIFTSLPQKQAVAVASVLAIGVSIITNFILNDVWTWGDREKRSSWLPRFGKYALVASVAAVVQWVVLQTLVEFGIHYLLANLVGIGAGIVINYAVNNWWTFRAVDVEAGEEDEAIDPAELLSGNHPVISPLPEQSSGRA